MIIQTYYVSTGAKNAMFTLRCHRDSDKGILGPFAPDFYICNLSADEETAAYKATMYFNAMRQRMGPDREDFMMHLDAWGGTVYERRGKLSVRDTQAMERIDAGYVPFGKHAGKRIDECEAGYLLWLSDKAGTFEGVPMNALAMVAQGVSLEKGYIAVREEKRAERAEADAFSVHVGTIGERLDFEGEVITSFEKKQEGVSLYWLNKIRCNGNLVTWISSKSIGEVGSVVKFKATVKKHDEYKGVKSTVINRPAIK